MFKICVVRNKGQCISFVGCYEPEQTLYDTSFIYASRAAGLCLAPTSLSKDNFLISTILLLLFSLFSNFDVETAKVYFSL